MTAIEIVLGDITVQDVDAIVTVANESGGQPVLAKAGAAIGPRGPGDATATPAFNLNLPVRQIIHTVGPV